MSETPRKSSRLQNKSFTSAERARELRKRIRSKQRSSSSSSEESSSANDEYSNEISVGQQRISNFTKVYSTYNMDKGLDTYEQDFIDDSDLYKKKDQTKKRIKTNDKPNQLKLRKRKIKFDSSSEEENIVRKAKRVKKFESDGEEVSPREKSKRAIYVQQQKERKKEEMLKELKASRSKVKEQSAIVEIMEESSSEGFDDDNDDTSDWIVSDDDNEYFHNNINTEINSSKILFDKMNLCSFLNNWIESEENSHRLITVTGKGDKELLTSLLSESGVCQVEQELNTFNLTLLHIAVMLPWLQTNSPGSPLECDQLACSILALLYQFKNLFCKLLGKGLKQHPTVMDIAVWYRREKCTSFLIEKCKEMNFDWVSYHDDDAIEWPPTILHTALICQLLEETSCSAAGIIDILLPHLDEGYINIRDKQGLTAAMYAAQLGDWKSLFSFLKSDLVSFEMTDYEGRSLLHLAAASGSNLCVQQLLDYGHRVDCKDCNGWPPLLYAHFSGHEDCFLMIMKAKPQQLSILKDLLEKSKSGNIDDRRKIAKVVRELLVSLAHSERYYSLFNKFIRDNLSVLDEESFDFMKHCMSLLSFENKQAWLKMNLNSLCNSISELNIDKLCLFDLPRTGLLKKVLDLVKDITAAQCWNSPPIVTFNNEPGICAGPRKEFWTCLSRDLSNGVEFLFTQCDNSQLSLQPYDIFSTSGLNHVSTIATSSKLHSHKLRVIGSLLATAIFHEDTLDCNLSVPLVKQILGQPLCYPEDLELVDNVLYNQLSNLLKEKSVQDLELTFSKALVCPWNGQVFDIPLFEGGLERSVTDENKLEYVKAMSQFILNDCIQCEIKNLSKGFYKVIPQKYISAFTPNEFSLLLSGVPHIDVDDWKTNTNYSGISSSHKLIDWFWKLVSDLSEQERALLLKFCTGSPRLPPGGFANLQGLNGNNKFTLSLSKFINKIPHAITCFNVLVLSNYSNEQQLRDKVLIAIRFGCEGFEFQ